MYCSTAVHKLILYTCLGRVDELWWLRYSQYIRVADGLGSLVAGFKCCCLLMFNHMFGMMVSKVLF